MEAEKAVAYPASSVCFSCFINILFWRFLEVLWRPVHNYSPSSPLSRSSGLGGGGGGPGGGGTDPPAWFLGVDRASKFRAISYFSGNFFGQ